MKLQEKIKDAEEEIKFHKGRFGAWETKATEERLGLLKKEGE